MEADIALDGDSLVHLLVDADRLLLFEGPYLLFWRHDLPPNLDYSSSCTLLLQIGKI